MFPQFSIKPGPSLSLRWSEVISSGSRLLSGLNRLPPNDSIFQFLRSWKDRDWEFLSCCVLSSICNGIIPAAAATRIVFLQKAIKFTAHVVMEARSQDWQFPFQDSAFHTLYKSSAVIMIFGRPCCHKNKPSSTAEWDSVIPVNYVTSAVSSQ